MVKVSVDRAVTLTTSAFAGVGICPVGQIATLKNGTSAGIAGNRAPSPAARTSEVPDVAGLGAVATVLIAKFFEAICYDPGCV